MRKTRLVSIKKDGFTLIELLVVISIIGILIGLTAVAFQSAKTSARDAQRKTDLETIRSGLEIYRTDCGSYPASLLFGLPLTGTRSSSPCGTSDTYIPTVPRDPLYSAGYLYSYSLLGGSYVLCSRLETGGSAVSGCGSCGGTGACNYKVGSP